LGGGGRGGGRRNPPRAFFVREKHDSPVIEVNLETVRPASPPKKNSYYGPELKKKLLLCEFFFCSLPENS